MVHRHPSGLDRRCPALPHVGRGRVGAHGGILRGRGCGRGRGCEPTSAVGRASWRRRPFRISAVVGIRDPREDGIKDLGGVGGLLGAAGRLAPDGACPLQGTDLAIKILLVACRCRIVSLHPGSSSPSGLGCQFRGTGARLERSPVPVTNHQVQAETHGR